MKTFGPGSSETWDWESYKTLEEEEFTGYRITANDKETFRQGCKDKVECLLQVEKIPIASQNYATQKAMSATNKLCGLYDIENNQCFTFCKLKKETFFEAPNWLSFCKELGSEKLKKECKDRILESYQKKNNDKILAYIAKRRAE